VTKQNKASRSKISGAFWGAQVVTAEGWSPHSEGCIDSAKIILPVSHKNIQSDILLLTASLGISPAYFDALD